MSTTSASSSPIIAEVPPHAPKVAAGPANQYKTLSGFEGREEELGRSMSILLKMLGNHAGYAHEMNDPLVKAHLLAIQFAKNQGKLAEYIEHDIKTMAPINLRMKQIIEKTGHPEIALVALFDRTACHYALALTSTGDGNSRTWKDPFGWVLAQCRKIGQFDLTSQEIHETWTIPRLLGYGAAMGVKLKVTPWQEDGMITCSLA
ncbi:MAG: hypothetical protein KJ049_10215 [Gammaproteobacteria bacterium]|jgi:hypothetical protein|nr:hypothetical protein [Gammaproteobacteria bacterium]